MAKLETQTMYRVEKFLPPECPKCRAGFRQEGKDYARFLGDIIDGKKTIRETNGYYIIICLHCENMTACWPLETYQVSDKSKAEALVKEEGFVNLVEVLAIGNMVQDRHAICGPVPRFEVMSSKPDEEGEDEPFVRE